ncbi:ARF GTPase-activating protein GIT1 [Brevipalpus obovatus]|uniref:ARF GTPase-activating protein GIT1 n=1 Tax=Brevipalpus obovatus TaxID=246614 RepID=UPI003D9F428D
MSSPSIHTMSLTRPKAILECADCSAPDSEWASVNHGVVICDECCIIHRNMGREVSQIKSLKKSYWPSSQYQMVMELNNSSSNSIWEHSLSSSTGGGSITSSLAHSKRPSSASRKKPSPRDPLHPNKNHFILAKYAEQAFIKKRSKGDGETSNVSEELHSSVRSTSLKTSLRLLAAGADPNFMHPEKGNTPLHVAAKSGQLLQIELLFAYGADPLKTDSSGKTALDHAKASPSTEIIDRLIEFQFEVTDRLSNFLCGRRPDHRQGQHYLTPEIVDAPVSNEDAKNMRSSLRNLNDRDFEELIKDVYDEVDRRELDEIFLQLSNTNASANPLRDRNLVPYLPVNAMFTSTHNQARQKLARFSARDFSFLLIDMLHEAKRRHLYSSQRDRTPSKNSHTRSQVRSKIASNIKSAHRASDDEDSDPLYDSVASEEERDYDEVEDRPRPNSKRQNSHAIKPFTELQNGFNKSNHRKSLEERLIQNDSLLRQILASNEDMKRDIAELKNTVSNLVDENLQLKALVVSRNGSNDSLGPVASCQQQLPPSVLPRSPAKFTPRSQSMFDRINPQIADNKPIQPHTISGTHGFRPSAPSPSALSQGSPIRKPTPPPRPPSSEASSLNNLQSAHDQSTNSPRPSIIERQPRLPAKEDVFRPTEQITKAIQELLGISQAENTRNEQEIYLRCAENIQRAVGSMISLFPDRSAIPHATSTEEKIFQITELLKSNCSRLMTECKSSPSPDSRKVIDSAYEIAKYAKQFIISTTEQS